VHELSLHDAELYVVVSRLEKSHLKQWVVGAFQGDVVEWRQQEVHDIHNQLFLNNNFLALELR